jgi:hypothetical protein
VGSKKVSLLPRTEEVGFAKSRKNVAAVLLVFFEAIGVDDDIVYEDVAANTDKMPESLVDASLVSRRRVAKTLRHHRPFEKAPRRLVAVFSMSSGCIGN